MFEKGVRAKVRCLLPYSPGLNSTELAFNNFAKLLRRSDARTQ
jgi:hypothetical protein